MTHEHANAAECWKTILADAAGKAHLLATIERFARTNTAPAPIVFGTSGWRGEIGTDYTFRNLGIVTTAVIEALRTGDGEFYRAMGVADFAEIQRRGAIIGHDNRFLGRDFAMEVAAQFQAAGIRTWYSGETNPRVFDLHRDARRSVFGQSYSVAQPGKLCRFQIQSCRRRSRRNGDHLPL
jgi:phosphomannomutase